MVYRIFYGTLNDQILEFGFKFEQITTGQTGIIWNVSGKSVEDEQFKLLIFGDYFAFAWLIFWPETTIYEE